MSNVLSMCEDHLGRMWLGGTGGNLICFDGYEFKEFSPEPLRGKGIYDIVLDADNRLWIASYGGGIHCLEGNTLLSYSDTNSLPGERLKVLDLEIDSEGIIWAGTAKYGLLRIDGEGFQHLTLEDGLGDITINAIHQHTSGDIYLGGYNGSITKISNNKLEVIYTADYMRTVYDMESKDDSLFVATSDGLLCFKNDQLLGDWKDLVDGESCKVRKIQIDHKGQMWLASYGQGLIEFNASGSSSHYNKASGLSSNRLLTLHEDRDNILWIGTYGSGLTRFLGEGIKTITTNEHPWSIVEHEGAILVGTNAGGMQRLSEDGTVRKAISYDEIAEELVFDLLSSGNELWCGTSNGLFCYRDGDLMKKYSEENGLLSGNVRVLITNNDGDVLVGTSKGVNLIENDIIYSIDKRKGLLSQDIHDLALVGEYILVGSNEGIAVLDQRLQLITHLSKEHGLPASTIYSFDLDEFNKLWVGTYGGGVAFIDVPDFLKGIQSSTENVQFQHFDQSMGLCSINVEAFWSNSPNELWVGTDFGLSKVDISDEDHTKWSFLNYGIEEGVRCTNIKSKNVLNADGKTYWCTDQKLVALDRKSIEVDQTPPQSTVHNLKLFFEPLEANSDEDERIREEPSYFKSLLGNYIQFNTVHPWTQTPENPVFSYDLNHLTFDFAATNWDRPRDVNYRYRLRNSDKDWLPATKDRKCTYQNLDPGFYEFEVQSSNAYGIWGESYVYPFTIQSPVWATTWFRILSGVFVIFLGFSFVKYRERRLKKENLILDTKVKERTKELAEEQEKSESLLLNILPKQTADELKKKGTATTRKYEEASVLFSDFKGFTQLTESVEAERLVVQLDQFFRSFDSASEQYKIEKIKTIGDAYMCACGIPKHTDNHALKLVAFGLEMIHITAGQNSELENPWPIRIGIHSGPLIAGVVGMKKFAYDIWGDTVNTASRMESSGEPGKLNISQDTYNLIKDYFDVSERGDIVAKNKGRLTMYFVEGFKPEFASKESPLLPNHRFLQVIRKEGVTHL
ncbi:MAG: hypothetical protein HRT74_08860 [Flavobacteriales bacterium]|nr:hypothetical protein [Flavobacteriales bacterium]